MDEHAAGLMPMPGTSQAAEGVPRRPWTVAEMEAMMAAGTIDEDERLELIGGEEVPMLLSGGGHAEGDRGRWWSGQISKSPRAKRRYPCACRRSA